MKASQRHPRHFRNTAKTMWPCRFAHAGDQDPVHVRSVVCKPAVPISTPFQKRILPDARSSLCETRQGRGVGMVNATRSPRNVQTYREATYSLSPRPAWHGTPIVKLWSNDPTPPPQQGRRHQSAQPHKTHDPSSRRYSWGYARSRDRAPPAATASAPRLETLGGPGPAPQIRNDFAGESNGAIHDGAPTEAI